MTLYPYFTGGNSWIPGLKSLPGASNNFHVSNFPESHFPVFKFKMKKIFYFVQGFFKFAFPCKHYERGIWLVLGLHRGPIRNIIFSSKTIPPNHISRRYIFPKHIFLYFQSNFVLNKIELIDFKRFDCDVIGNVTRGKMFWGDVFSGKWCTEK
jgi:hypothetical protein